MSAPPGGPSADRSHSIDSKVVPAPSAAASAGSGGKSDSAADLKDGVRWEDIPNWHEATKSLPVPTASAAAAASGGDGKSGAPNFKPSEAINRKVMLWRGDITKLVIGSIMNAANEPLAGCNIPNHCIDSAICTAAGPELQDASHKLGPIGAGECVITPGFKLLCPYVIHVVGPRCGLQYNQYGRVVANIPPNPERLRAGYINSLDLMRKNGVRSIALCCLSTGMFGYPKVPAGSVAMQAVRDWLSDVDNFAACDMIVFCTFDQGNTELYQLLMPKFFPSAHSTDTAATSASASGGAAPSAAGSGGAAAAKK